MKICVLLLYTWSHLEIRHLDRSSENQGLRLSLELVNIYIGNLLQLEKIFKPKKI